LGLGDFDVGFWRNVCLAIYIIKEAPAGFFPQFVDFDTGLGFIWQARIFLLCIRS